MTPGEFAESLPTLVDVHRAAIAVQKRRQRLLAGLELKPGDRVRVALPSDPKFVDSVFAEDGFIVTTATVLKIDKRRGIPVERKRLDLKLDDGSTLGGALGFVLERIEDEDRTTEEDA